MALPQAVDRQIEEAEALQKQVYPDVSAVDNDQTDTTAPAAAPARTAQIVDMPVVAAPAAPMETSKPDDAALWKQKFDSLQGKYNAEVPRFQTQLREQDAQLQRLQDQIAALQQPTDTAKPDSLATQKDIDDFGEDLISAMRRTAREEAQKAYAAEVTALEAKFGAVDERVGRVAHQQAQSVSDQFWGAVINTVPDWKTIDSNPAWVTWLDTTPEYSEDTYRTIATKAIDRGNVDKVAALVRTWKHETNQLEPTPPAGPTRQQTELSRQVTPSTVKSTAAPTSQKIYSSAEFEAMYDARNVQRYGDKRADELIAEADLAVAENRVRW